MYPFIPWPGADGLLEASMHAQWFAPFPVLNAFGPPVRRNPQAFAYLPLSARYGMEGRRRLGEKPVFCHPGYVPVPTGVPGQSRCVFYSPPSAMVGQPGVTTVSTTTPPSYPTGRTFPVGPSYFNGRPF